MLRFKIWIYAARNGSRVYRLSVYDSYGYVSPFIGGYFKTEKGLARFIKKTLPGFYIREIININDFPTVKALLNV